MVKKLIFVFLLIVITLTAADDIFVYSSKNINKIEITLRKEGEGQYREYIRTEIDYFGYIPWREEKILPEAYTEQVNILNLDQIIKPVEINVDSITLQLKLETTPLYGREFYKIQAEKGDKIKCIIHDKNEQHNGFIEVSSKTPKTFAIRGTLKVISVNMVLNILNEYVSPKGECWNIQGESIVSDFFETISASHLPPDDFATIKVLGVTDINPKELKFQAMNKSMDQMQEIKFIRKGDNTFQIPNLKFYNLTCWYNNKKQDISEQFTLVDHLNRRVTFNYTYNGKSGEYVKQPGKTAVYLPYPQRRIESISCTFANSTKAVTLKDNHDIVIDEPIAIVLDLNSTRTTNKKNKFDYIDFIKKIHSQSENSSVRLFKLLYVFPREATFEKFNIEKVYTKFKDTQYSTVDAGQSAAFVKWRQNREKSSIDPLNIPEDYFCLEVIEDKGFFDKGLSSTLVKENMADRRYVQNFEYVLERLEQESRYKFIEVVYVSYFPVLPMYKVDGVKYISFLKDHENFNLNNIIN